MWSAASLSIESPRWSGVPFRLRTGKHLAESATEAVVVFKRPARLVSVSAARPMADPDVVRFRLGRDDGVTISLQAKQPGQRAASRPVNLSVDFDDALGDRREAYERLLADVIDGRHHRFSRWDVIEQQWRIVDGVLDLPETPRGYPAHSWGPTSDSELAPQRWQRVGSQTTNPTQASDNHAKHRLVAPSTEEIAV